jgi:hypothetical protein
LAVVRVVTSWRLAIQRSGPFLEFVRWQF